MGLVLLGLTAATLSPLMMTVGFIIWESAWKGSAYSLNAFKCSLAGSIFLAISLSIRYFPQAPSIDLWMLLLSSLIGIVIGDNTWLLALQMIGAKKVILIDTLKPFLASLLGYFYLGEPITYDYVLGIILSSIGILIVSLETTQSDSDDNDIKAKSATTLKRSNIIGDTAHNVIYDQLPLENANDEEYPSSEWSTSSDKKPDLANVKGDIATNDSITNEGTSSTSSGNIVGYSLAAVNVIFDAFGSLLTKQYGIAYNTWEVKQNDDDNSGGGGPRFFLSLEIFTLIRTHNPYKTRST